MFRVSDQCGRFFDIGVIPVIEHTGRAGSHQDRSAIQLEDVVGGKQLKGGVFTYFDRDRSRAESGLGEKLDSEQRQCCGKE